MRRSVAPGLARVGTALLRAAVPVAWAALLVFAAVVFTRPHDPALARALAWVSGVVVLAWLAAHLRARHHGARGARRDLSRELPFAVQDHGPRRGSGGRRSPPGWYGGRSHAGERPRFD